MSSPLTDRRRRFVAEYLVDHNATQAAIRAGYSPRSAKVTASRLLTDPAVEAALREALEAQRKRLALEADSVLGELMRIGFLDPAEIDPDGKLGLKDLPEDARRALSSVKVRSEADRDGKITTTREFRFWPKNDALVALGRHLKLFTDRVEAEIAADLTDEERARRVAAILARARARGGDDGR